MLGRYVGTKNYEIVPISIQYEWVCRQHYTFSPLREKDTIWHRDCVPERHNSDSFGAHVSFGSTKKHSIRNREKRNNKWHKEAQKETASLSVGLSVGLSVFISNSIQCSLIGHNSHKSIPYIWKEKRENAENKSEKAGAIRIDKPTSKLQIRVLFDVPIPVALAWILRTNYRTSVVSQQ